MAHRALVTGGAGFIGQHLVRSLIENGWNVTVWDNLSTSKVKPKCDQFHEVDLACKKLFFLPKFDFDVVFHLAALARVGYSFRKPAQVYFNNVISLSNLLELASQDQTPIIYASSSSVLEPTKNIYALSKFHGEQLIYTYREAFNYKAYIARFYNVYGSGHWRDGLYAPVLGQFERQYLHGEPLTVTGDGSQKRDFTHVEDVVNGLMSMANLILNNSFERVHVNLARGEVVSILDIARAFGVPIQFIPARPGEMQVSKSVTQFESLPCVPRIHVFDYIRNFVKNNQYGSMRLTSKKKRSK